MTDENPWAGQGAVLLDIGGDVGAVVVHMPAAMVGEEIEIVPLAQLHAHDHPTEDPHHPHDHAHHHPAGHGHDHGHDHGHRPHVAVVDRPVMGPTLVFPEVVCGEYALVDKGGHHARLTVTVEGGMVTTADWPGA